MIKKLKTYHFNNSEFKIPVSWTPMGQEGSNSETFNSPDLSICYLTIWQLEDNEYKTELYPNETELTYSENRWNETVNGTTIEVLKWNNSASEVPAGYEYFFEKNSKFYKLGMNAKSNDVTTSESFLNEHNSTINYVINTM